MQKHIRFIVSFQVKSLLLVYTSFTCLGVTVLGMAGVMAYIFRMQVLFLVMKNCDDYAFTHYVMIVMTMVMTKWKGWGDGLYLRMQALFLVIRSCSKMMQMVMTK